jgi:hypothetical protein
MAKGTDQNNSTSLQEIEVWKRAENSPENLSRTLLIAVEIYSAGQQIVIEGFDTQANSILLPKLDKRIKNYGVSHMKFTDRSRKRRRRITSGRRVSEKCGPQ